MTALYCTLLLPLVGTVLLGFVGHSRKAGWINVGVSALTFGASLWLALNVLEGGAILSPTRCSTWTCSTSTWWRSRPSSD